MHKKKRLIDSRDREILKLLIQRKLTGFQIAKRINMSAPAIKPRLNNLKNKGIIKVEHIGKLRTFQRTFNLKNKKQVTKTITAPSKILWGIDTIKKKRGKNYG